MVRVPIVMLKYSFTLKTNITFGMQGIKGMEFYYKDYIQSHNNYKKKNYTLQIENRSDYFGFVVWGGFGFRLEDIKFDKVYREFENFKTSSFFMQIYIGY